MSGPVLTNGPSNYTSVPYIGQTDYSFPFFPEYGFAGFAKSCPIFTRTVPHAADRSHARTALIPASKLLLPLDPPTPHQGRVGSGQCNGCIFLDCARRPPSAASVRLVIQRRFPNHLPVLRSLTAGDMNPPKELAGVKVRTVGYRRRWKG